MSMCPLSHAGATVQPQPLWRPEGQPERMGESVATVEAAGQGGEAPEMAGTRRAVLEQGSKRTTPKQGMSDRPVK
jgi:hypothetical protein